MAIQGFSEVNADLELDKGLRKGALGLWSTVNLGLASTAPAYSLAATIAFVVMAVGNQAPIVMLLAFVPMWLTAVAYRELNSVIPDCGTTFTWATKAFGPKTGWMGGWGIAIAGIIFMTSAAEVSATYFYSLIGVPDLSSNRFIMLATGSIFVAIMTYITYRGIEGAAKLQYAMVALQIISLGLLSIVSLIAVAGGSGFGELSMLPQVSWFNPFEISSWSAFVQGFLLCLFIYWGFDTTLAVNEETDDAATTPGRAAILSTIILMFLYVFVTVAALSYLGLDELSSEENSSDIFAIWAEPVLGLFGAKLLAFTVLVSTISSMMTTILPTARGTLAMAIYRAIPKRFAVVHPRYMTPSFSTTMMGTVSIALFIGLSLISSNVLQDAVASTSLAIAFYYGLTGWAAVWFFRKQSLRSGPRELFNKFVFPLAGALILTYALLQSAYDSLDPDYGYTTIWGIGGVFVIGVGSLAVGGALMVVTMLFMPDFFRGKTLHHDSPVLVPEE
jgi:amino acid transporter